MRKYVWVLVIFTIITGAAGCSARYRGKGLDDFHKSSELLSRSLAGVYSEIIEGDMELRAEKSAEMSSITEKDLEPVMVSYQNLRAREGLAESLVIYARFIRNFLSDDHSAALRESGEELVSSLQQIRDTNPGLSPGKAGGILATLISMGPEGYSRLKKRKTALRIMEEMQKVLEMVSRQLNEEVGALRQAAPLLFTRLFRERVENNWPEKKEKRVKAAMAGVKIIRRRELFLKVTGDLIRILEMVPNEHRKLIRGLRRGDGTAGLTDLLNFSVRLKRNYDLLMKGDG